MSNEIKLFKLVTSEEIVTRVIKEEETYFLLEKPRLCAIQQGQDAEGNQGNFLNLLNWMMYAQDPTVEPPLEKDVKLYKNVIAGEAVEVPAVMEKRYLSDTSSIQLV